MKKLFKLKVLVILIFCPVLNIFPQKELFTVIASSGTALYISKNMADWTDLTTGSKLFQGDKVKIDNNGYVGLCYVNGRTVELSKKGVFNIDDLAKSLTAENASVTRKFTDYIMNEIIVKNKTKEMKNIAGVVRQNLTYIDKDFPASTVVVDSVVTFRWYPVKDVKSYAFEIQNSLQEAILLKETKDTSIEVNIKELDLQPGDCYKWFVFDPDSQSISSDSSCIMVITNAEYKSLQDTLADLKADLSDSQSPLGQLILATFFEKNNMNLNALKHYEAALKYLDQVEDYKKKYLLFLVNTGLYRRAQKAMEKWDIY